MRRRRKLPTSINCGYFRASVAARHFVMMTLIVLGLGATSVSVAQVQRLSFSGGPDNSTLQFFAEGLSTLLSRSIEDVEVSYIASAGAIENLDRVGNGSADFSIVHSGDLYRSMYLHAQGAASPHRNVQPLSFLFGLQAHLIVLKESDISAAEQLAGRQVAVGSAGSGGAAAAQHFFESLGVWNRMSPQFLTPEQGVTALIEGSVDALWVFTAVPSTSVMHATSDNNVRMLNVDAATQSGTLTLDHPYYTPVTIPADTYPGINQDVLTIQESALWVAGSQVSEERTYQAINEVYSDAGLSFMHTITSAAGAMSIDNALNGVFTPLHAGARMYWSEKGLGLTDAQQ